MCYLLSGQKENSRKNGGNSMKMSCHIIQDLLPLYVENLTSDDSNELVKEHMKGCTSCNRICEEMRQNKSVLQVPEDLEILPERQMNMEEGISKSSLKRVKKELIKRKLNAVCLAVFSIIVIMLFVFIRLTTPHYQPYSEDLISITEDENGNVYAEFSEEVTAYHYDIYQSEDSGKIIMDLQAWNCAWDQILGKGRQRVLISSKENPVELVYYCDCTEGENMTVIYGENPPEGVRALPRLVLGYYLFFAAVGAIITGILWIIFREKKAGIIFRYCFFVPVSYLIGHILVKGLSTMTVSAMRDFIMITIMAIAVYGIFISAIQIILQKKKLD